MSPIEITVVFFSCVAVACVLSALSCGYFNKHTCKNCEHHLLCHHATKVKYKNFEDNETHYCTKAKRFKLKDFNACSSWQRPWEY